MLLETNDALKSERAVLQIQAKLPSCRSRVQRSCPVDLSVSVVRYFFFGIPLLLDKEDAQSPRRQSRSGEQMCPIFNLAHSLKDTCLFAVSTLTLHQ